MAQKTFAAGNVLTAADTNLYLMHEGGAWSTWVPVVTQSGTVTCTVNRAVYARASRLIHFEALLTVTGSGTANNDISVTLPVAAAFAGNSFAGMGQVYDASAPDFIYWGPLVKTSTTVVKIASDSGTTGRYLGGTSAAFAAGLATSDSITIHGFYEAAS